MNNFTTGCAVIYLDDGANGAKIGLDDFFVAGGTVPEFQSQATTELRPLPRSERDHEIYALTGEGTIWNRQGRDGP